MKEIDAGFDRVFYTVGIVSKIPLENSQVEIVAALEAARGLLGSGEIEVKSEKDRIDLADRTPTAPNRQFELTVMQKRAVLFAMGKGFSPEERRTNVERLFESLTAHLAFVPAALEYIDKKVKIETKARANPETALASILQGSPLGRLLGEKQLYAVRPVVLFSTDEDATRFCRLEMESNVSIGAVRMGRFDEPPELEVTCSVGQTGHLEAISDLVKAVMDHLDFSRDFLIREVVPFIFDPIRDALEHSANA